MEVPFSLFHTTGSIIPFLNIESSNLSKWFEHIKPIGPSLREIAVNQCVTNYTTIMTITEYCPYLEKLCCSSTSGLKNNNILQTLANNCPLLRSLSMFIDYPSNSEAVADLTAFAEKCPQLEELRLYCRQLTDQCVIALAQHCSRLKKLKLLWSQITAASLIALSERGLPLEELEIPSIPIPSAEIAAQCAHALSQTRDLGIYNDDGTIEQHCYTIQYMVGLRKLWLCSSEDHMLMPKLLPQNGRCVSIELLHIHHSSSITSKQLNNLISKCFYLEKVIILWSEVTEKGVLALAAHCRQLRGIHLPWCTVTEETVRHLAQHCRHLTKLKICVYVREGEVMLQRSKDYSSREIKVLRENNRESSCAEVITYRSKSTCYMVL